jgi:hypothetical protein
MIEVAVREYDCIQLAILDLRCATILCALLFAPLEKTAVDQNARVLSDDVIRRARYITCGPKKTNFHNCS